MCELKKLEIMYLSALEDIKAGRFKIITDAKAHVEQILKEIDAIDNKNNIVLDK